MTRNSLAGLALATLAALGLAASSAQAQTTFTAWNFANTPIAVNNSPAATTGAGTATSLGMTNSYSNSGSGSITTDDIISTPGTADAAFTENTWRIRGGNGTAGGTPDGWSLSAPQYTQGAQFSASTVGYTNVSVTYDWYCTTQGILDLQEQYTTNGTTWTNIGPLQLATSNDFYGDTATGPAEPEKTISFAGVSGVSNDPNFGIRLVSAYDPTAGTYLSSAGGTYNNSSGNWRFGNISFTGTPAAAPEPGSVAGMAVGTGILGMLVARRRKSVGA
jgi:hypothetical protein